MRQYLLSAASLLAFAIAAGTAGAETYQASTWLEPGHILTKDGYDPYLDEIRAATEGAVDFEFYTSASLLPAQTTLSGVGDGVAQMGLVAASYQPSELPLSGMVNDLAFAATDPMATALALTEIAMTNQRFIDEYGQHGTVVLGAYSTPTYMFACMSDVTSTDNIRGKKIRTAGTAQNEWIGSLGAIPVAVVSNDIYSGLERGSIDCTLSDATVLENGPKFGEVIRSLTMLEQGATLGMTYIVNKDFWTAIGPESRRRILDATAAAVARTQIGYDTAVSDALDKTRARGVAFNEPEQSLVDALAAFRENVVESFPKRTEAERGVADPTSVAQEFLALQDKWHGLLEGVDRGDVDAVAALVAAEIYSRLDENTYGL
ncbi:MAG TPA: C4-dicarboxylate TRAP transporter substrate-binding protein [Paracoccus solventivorans]|uniref:C4-dicarboxylate TRAP transporter substrate-binding protein n=1 Tax=Paracoccus solventivorans TaxID=53463 RepID=UPI002B83A23F|nr:C4-dicarboxylate TRAP transporter substrate-binding protein [Paracoccus solventivorans]HMM08730.1 C4-dicarboxylate TRAP transporter substrate-binding protein [Paracoccus solventivorans]